MKKLHKLNLALHWIRIIFPIKKFILQNGEISPKGSYGLLWALQSFQHPKTHFCCDTLYETIDTQNDCQTNRQTDRN